MLLPRELWQMFPASDSPPHKSETSLWSGESLLTVWLGFCGISTQLGCGCLCHACVIQLPTQDVGTR